MFLKAGWDRNTTTRKLFGQGNPRMVCLLNQTGDGTVRKLRELVALLPLMLLLSLLF